MTPAPSSDARVVAVVAVGHALLWALVATAVYSSPPVDVVESGMWGRIWPLTTYKHPAMPAWLLELSWLLTGAIGWPAYLLSAACVVAVLGLVFAIGRETVGSVRAAIAALALVAIEPMSWHAPSFNHSLLQMPFSLATILLGWRVATHARARDWLLLGLFAGLGLYAKMTHGLVVVSVTLWLLLDRRVRVQLTTPWPWLGALLAAAIAAPVLTKLLTDPQMTIYALWRGRANGPASVALFPLQALLMTLPALCLIGLGLLRWRAREQMSLQPVPPRALSFLASVALGPIVLLQVLALFAGSGLKGSWASVYVPLLPLLVVAVCRHEATSDAVRRQTIIAGIASIVMATGYAVDVSVAGDATFIRMKAPGPEMSQRLGAHWLTRTGQPLRIVAGDTWAASVVGLTHPDRPRILTIGIFARAPWLRPADVMRDGALVVWDQALGPITPELQALIGGRPTETMQFATRQGVSIALTVAVVPPAGR